MYKKGIKNMSMICCYLQADDGMLQNLISGEEIPSADTGKSLSIDQAWEWNENSFRAKFKMEDLIANDVYPALLVAASVWLCRIKVRESS